MLRYCKIHLFIWIVIAPIVQTGLTSIDLRRITISGVIIIVYVDFPKRGSARFWDMQVEDNRTRVHRLVFPRYFALLTQALWVAAIPCIHHIT